MDTFDEFKFLESMIQKSEDSFLKHHRKKHKSDSFDMDVSEKEDEKSNDICSYTNDSVNNESNQMQFLKDIIVKEFDKHQDLSQRDELIKKLCHRLYRALQNNEEFRKSENLIVQELEDVRKQMSQFSSLVHFYKDSIQSNKECNENQDNSNPSIPFLENESLEIGRRQLPINSQQNSLLFKDTVAQSQVDKFDENKAATLCQNSQQICDESKNSVDKILLDQIKTLEENIQSERQFYITENDRLNVIIEENYKVIDELKKELKRPKPSSNTTIHNKSNLDSTDTAAAKDYSRLQGLFDWPIEEPTSSDATFEDSYAVSSNNFQTNNRLLHVLSDLVKTFLDTENDIQKQLESLGLENKSPANLNRTDENLLGFPSLEDERMSELTLELCEDGPDLTPSSMLYSNQSVNLSNISATNDIEDDVVLGASRRLRLAVERVLKILSEIVDHHNEHDLKELLKQKDDLAEELQAECGRSDQLTRQLLDKEKMVHQLENEKKRLLEQVADYNEIKSQHDQLRLKLDEFERDREKFLNDHKRFELEKVTFSQGLPKLQQKLFRENELLNQDIHQLQQDKLDLLKRIQTLSSDLENVKSEKDQLLESRNVELDELISQLDASEKNLSSLKRFIEEQTQEREFEREEFNKELNALKHKIKEKEKQETRFKSTVRSLESQITMLNEDKTAKDEQMTEIGNNLKEANLKISELNLIVRQLESDLEHNNQVENELRNKMKELSKSLNIKLNDETNWEDLINVISKFVDSKSENKIASELPDNPSTHEHEFNEHQHLAGEALDNSLFVTIKKMDDKIAHLDENINSLILKNDQLKSELNEKNAQINRLEECKSEMEALERNFRETAKANDLLRQEINDNHIRYSELKVKLESSVDVNEFRKVVGDLQTKLSHEKKQQESMTIKLEQANRHVHELNEKLDAYKKEIKSYKELFKSYEQDNKTSSKDRLEYRNKYQALVEEMNQLGGKLTNKDKTIALLEQNVDMLKSKLTQTTNEKNIYYDQLQTAGDQQNKLVIYEKNLEKLRLQNKISSDKITYLELEIQNLRRKIEILERENELLKVDNQKLSRLKHEMNVAMFELDDGHAVVDGATDSLNTNGNPALLYLSGLEKLNSISSNNLLMLKVRRLLTQKGALIYQKNYLIHVLGSYQRTENDTLALLANFNNNSKDNEDCYVAKIRGKSKFRSTAYALIALSRMRYLVNIWQCRKRQLLLNKTAHSIATNLQNVPVPPKKVLTTKIVPMVSPPSSSSSSPPSSTSPIHRRNHVHHHHKHPLPSRINSTLKDYVDRLHVVHETLGLHTNKL